MNSLTKTTARFTQHREADKDRLQWRWRLESDRNDEPLANGGEGYNNFADMVHGFAVSTGAQVTDDGSTVTAVRYCLDEEGNLLRDEIEVVITKVADTDG